MKFISAIVALITLEELVQNMGTTGEMAEIFDYFPDVSDDLSKVTWAHAVNSKQELEHYLADSSVLMLETDISMGHLVGELTGKEIPIMAHPPNKTSDISVVDWLMQVIDATSKGTKKGVKLDFKDLKAVKPTFEAIRKFKERIDFPFWINADIVKGPVQPTKMPIDAEIFLSLCREFFPMATLSLGWVTRFTSVDDENAAYTRSMMENMIQTVSSNHIEQPVTFPIRAAFIGRSLPEIEWLMDNVEGVPSTVTVWSSPTDTVDPEALVSLVDLLGHDVVYFDLPEDQASNFKRAKLAKENAQQEQQKAGAASFTAVTGLLNLLGITLSLL